MRRRRSRPFFPFFSYRMPEKIRTHHDSRFQAIKTDKNDVFIRNEACSTFSVQSMHVSFHVRFLNSAILSDRFIIGH